MARVIAMLLHLAHAHAGAGAGATVQDRPVGRQREKTARKPFLPTTRRGKALVCAVGAFILSLLFASFGTESIGWPKVGGDSMGGKDGAIQQPVYWPFGDPSVRHRGAYVHLNRDIAPTVGVIVMFRHGEDRDVKRVEKIREDGALWVMADNVGVTGMDSREYGWIPASDVVGVVDRILTPSRIIRAFTVSGRLQNGLELTNAPAKLIWSPDYTAVAVEEGDHVSVYGRKGVLATVLELGSPRWISASEVEIGLYGIAGFCRFNTDTGSFVRTVADKLTLPARVKAQARIGKGLSLKTWFVPYALHDEVEVVWNGRSVRVKPLKLAHLDENGPPGSMFGFLWGPKTMEAEFLIRPISG